ncbi:peptidyl-prolyl cis-trans isomerase [Commensalibacter nepenthis]|uniref:Parvulin-like PPIase n=1 Tax=Commensalibacter nepenthis TaxID=3043872 RepID=A0ABT6Q544_9PROT|nr:peptidyl-prolyl cis-trans isomerase [Commensalibacter sp. TBRC 10068]MDI2111862.1 peptidyl-prolyl cis-trans isomerase [Commensalibacter sp. TBRC 10068]
MLSRLRHLLIDSWFGRVLVGLIFLVFISWGAETIIDTWSHRDSNVVAWIGDKTITLQQLDSAANLQLQQYAAQQGFSDKYQIPSGMRAQLVNQALQKLIIENNLIIAAEKSGLTVSDDALRNLIFSFPAFQKEGKFDRELFNQYIRQTNQTEPQFLEMLRNQLMISGLTVPIVSGASASDIMAKNIFAFSNETRQLNYIQVPFNTYKPDATPSDAVLKRYYDNHLSEFTVPEYRKIKLIFISPETVQKGVEVSDQQVSQYYNSRKKEFQKPESRNIEIITVKDQNAAKAIASSWNKDSWENIQKQTQQNNGFATTLTEFTAQSSPSAELADAVQKAAVNTVSAPIKTPMGWSVFKVTGIVPPHEIALDQVKDQLKSELIQAQSKQDFPSNIKKIQDVLAGSQGLDEDQLSKLGGLGIIAVTGTLNEQGLTLQNNPAPLPSDEKVKKTMLMNIFSKAKNAPASLIQGENNIYYAFIVEDILPAHQESFEKAKDFVLQSWQQQNIKRQANIAATTVFKQAQDTHKPIQDLGSQQFSVKVSDSFSRLNPSKTLPAELQREAFSMQVGQTTMVEGSDSFYVASLSNVKTPTPQENPAAYKELKDNLMQANGDDIYSSYVIFVNKQGKVDVNQKAVDAIVKQGNY